jgi:hypothetical protein
MQPTTELPDINELLARFVQSKSDTQIVNYKRGFSQQEAPPKSFSNNEQVRKQFFFT